jgi:hypothetical protein
MKIGPRIGELCPKCGQEVRLVSAERLLGGKKKAKVMVECGCSTWLHHPRRERLLIRRHVRKVVS